MGDHGRKFKITRIEWLSGIPLQHAETIRARVHYQTTDACEDVAIGMGFSTLEGVRLLTYETDFQDGHRINLKPGASGYADVQIAELPVAPGIYSLDVGARSGDVFALDYVPAAAQIEITMGMKTPGYIVRQGAGVRLAADWHWAKSGD